MKVKNPKAPAAMRIIERVAGVGWSSMQEGPLFRGPSNSLFISSSRSRHSTDSCTRSPSRNPASTGHSHRNRSRNDNTVLLCLFLNVPSRLRANVTLGISIVGEGLGTRRAGHLLVGVEIVCSVVREAPNAPGSYQDRLVPAP